MFAANFPNIADDYAKVNACANVSKNSNSI